MIGVGCSATPSVEVPVWTVAERTEQVVTDPIELPTLCAIPWPQDSTECWSALDRYDIAAGSNYTIAQANANALRATESAYDHLWQAGRYQQELAQLRQELLEDERRMRAQDKWYYRGIIGLFLVGIGVGVAQ